MRVALRLAYLGTHLAGWQIQPARGLGSRTAQGDLETALARLYKVEVRVHGAGRTDAGVHAEGQVCHADLPDEAPPIPFDGLRKGLNAILPGDIRVLAAWEPAEGWHARFSASGKVYRYRLRLGDHLHPHLGLVEALAREALDVPAMRAAAAHLVGRRDFAPFSVTGSDVSTTVRTLHHLDVREEGTLLTMTAVGDGFLRQMVRRLVGTLREVGRGRVPAAAVLFHPGPTAEARGLTLERVLYPPEDPAESRWLLE